MAGRFLFDTNIIIALFSSDRSVLDAVQRADEVFVPAVALGELHYGAEKSSRPEANAARIEEFAARCAVLPCDAVTGRHYGRIKHSLHRKGTPSGSQ